MAVAETCSWCDKSPVGYIEVEPAKFRDVRVTNPVTGEVTKRRHMVQRSIEVPACEAHAGIGEGQPPVIVCRSRSRKPHAQQLDLLGDGPGDGARNAILGND